MDTATVWNAVAASSQALTGDCGVAISIALYLHNLRQREDAWLQQFGILHEQFWNDKDIAMVRSWIANDDAYKDIRDVLVVRRQGRECVSAAQYKLLEALDKFMNLLMRAHLARKISKSLDEMWDRLFFEYWLDEIRDAEKPGSHRQELCWYVQTFYSELLKP